MTAKFLTAVLVVAAFGCANSASTPKAPVTATKTTHKRVAVAKPRAPSPAPVAQEQTQTTSDTNGIALHGPEKTYLEQVDNSGWSGRSPAPPTATGGGPAAEDTENSDTEQQSEEK